MIAVVDAKTGHAPELRAAIGELAAAVRREPGCLTFVPYQDLGTDGRYPVGLAIVSARWSIQ